MVSYDLSFFAFVDPYDRSVMVRVDNTRKRIPFTKLLGYPVAFGTGIIWECQGNGRSILVTARKVCLGIVEVDVAFKGIDPDECNGKDFHFVLADAENFYGKEGEC